MSRVTYGLENLNELLDQETLEFSTEGMGREVGEGNTYKTVATTSLVTLVSYMMGLDIETMENHYKEQNEERIRELQGEKSVTIIRYLNRLRTTLMLNFKKIDDEMVYNLGNIDRMPYFHQGEIKQLQAWGINVVKTNMRAEKYNLYFCELIAKYIDDCKSFFPDWVNFEYIKDLFIVPSYEKAGALKSEFAKYMENRKNYPFQMYIHWNPGEYGNILSNDGKFLATIYAQHKDVFLDRSKYRDAKDDTKQSIYNYIHESNRVVIVVDCENSDVYKLFGVLKNLEEEELEKIEKIMLYDDYHTSAGWDWLEKFIHIQVEHIEVERVADHKSLVDICMTVGVCEAYYRDQIDSFILCSSDSDFWGLISSLPDARFLVFYEYAKCGKVIKDALNLRQIYHCAMDDFYTGNAGELKQIVLKKELESRLPQLLGENSRRLLDILYEKARITASDAEKQRFYEKYIKTLKLKMNENGDFYIEMMD